MVIESLIEKFSLFYFKADSSQLSIHDEEEGDTIASLCKTNPEDVQNDEEEAKNEPTHYSKLDLKKMKVN